MTLPTNLPFVPSSSSLSLFTLIFFTFCLFYAETERKKKKRWRLRDPFGGAFTSDQSRPESGKFHFFPFQVWRTLDAAAAACHTQRETVREGDDKNNFFISSPRFYLVGGGDGGWGVKRIWALSLAYTHRLHTYMQTDCLADTQTDRHTDTQTHRRMVQRGGRWPFGPAGWCNDSNPH